ncbi:hypothetical protein VN97_g9270 [Penicillium thymicola]|uniref:Uncharacterized protein n=1 Tax=Penicillium thymicola TaxID=293382 RepID=A0AAI9X5D6_PENTH|nr:hypothetical protein VN97_g9270 [Penicillium thymicola]
MLVYSAKMNWQWEKGEGVSDENQHSLVSRAQRPTPSLPDMLDEVPKADNVFDTIEAHCQTKFQALNKTLMHTQPAMILTKGGERLRVTEETKRKETTSKARKTE